MKFTVPDAPWTLILPQGGLTIEKQEIQPNGQAGYFDLSDQKTGINVSFYIEPISKCTTSRECRDMVWKLGNPGWENPQNLVLSEYGDISVFEFLVPSFKGVPVNQQNIYAEFASTDFGSTCIFRRSPTNQRSTACSSASNGRSCLSPRKNSAANRLRHLRPSVSQLRANFS